MFDREETRAGTRIKIGDEVLEKMIEFIYLGWIFRRDGMAVDRRFTKCECRKSCEWSIRKAIWQSPSEREGAIAEAYRLHQELGSKQAKEF